MSMPTGRSEKRTPVELAVLLSRAHKKPFKERGVTENVSSHGCESLRRVCGSPELGCSLASPARTSTNRRVLFIVNAWQKASLLWGSNSQRRCRVRLLNLPGCRFFAILCPAERGTCMNISRRN